MEKALHHRDLASGLPDPKAQGSKLRPLGIPVIMDRCHQNRAKNALEPEWEARFEPRSYGFRPGRSCQDAIEAIYDTCKGNATRVWTLDADLAAAFDKLDHHHLMSAIGLFPGRGMIRAWLTAGVFEPGKGFAPTEEGSPQGGVISPLLLNVAVHGLEEAAGVRFKADGARTALSSPVLVRYCDDFVVCCHTRQQAEQVKSRLAEWLAPRGLAFNEDKTRIVSLQAGYDFLGFNVRRYRNGKLLIKPSKAAVRRVKRKLAEQMRRLRGQNVSALLAAICPITRGWASFYRSVVSKKTFNTLDGYLWKLTYKWARRSHPGKPTYWVTKRYYGQFNPFRRNMWVFGDAASGAYLPPLAWTPIIRHRKVSSGASVDDPALTDYWNQRRGRNQPSLRWTAAPCACSRCSMDAASSARTCSCTPIGSPTLPRNGNSGTAPPAKRSPGNSSSHAGRTAHRMTPVWYTPTANAEPSAMAADNRHLHAPEPPFGACLSRMRLAPHVRS